MAALLWIVAGVVYLGLEAYAAHRFPGYSYSADYISDLGDPARSPAAAWMNVAFVQQGVLFGVAAWLSRDFGALTFAERRLARRNRWFVGLATAYGVGSVVVGAVHSGHSGLAHTAHVAGAATAIVAGNLALLAAGIAVLKHRRAVGIASVVLGSAGLLSGALLLAGGAVGWERAAVYSITAWQLVIGATLMLRHKPLPGG